MTDVRFVAVDPTFEVVVSDELASVGAAERREIERLWSEELAPRYDRSADAPVLAYVASDRRRLTARWVTLRELAAGRHDPRLFDWKPPVPVGVCGRISIGGRVLLGRRSAGQAAWAGYWELAPSNDLDRAWSVAGNRRIDVGLGLRCALAATTPLAHAARSQPETFALAFDERQPAWRVCVAQELVLEPGLVERLEQASSERYDTFRLAQPEEVIEAGLLRGSDLVPMTAALVRLPTPVLQAAG